MSTPAPPPAAFFVYGTLRRGYANHVRHLQGRIARVAPAAVHGYRLHHGPGYPFAVPATRGRIVGEAVWPDPGHAALVLADLDRLEEYDPDRPGAALYERVVAEAHLLDGSEPAPVRAWLYVAGPAARGTAGPLGPPLGVEDWTDVVGPAQAWSGARAHEATGRADPGRSPQSPRTEPPP